MSLLGAGNESSGSGSQGCPWTRYKTRRKGGRWELGSSTLGDMLEALSQEISVKMQLWSMSCLIWEGPKDSEGHPICLCICVPMG